MKKPGRLRGALVVAAAVAVGTLVACKWFACNSAPEGWKSSAPPAAPADLMEGAWEGSWSSDNKPLNGWMKAVIERLPDGDYRASFVSQNPLGADDKSVCVFHISERGPVWKFSGKEDLGFFKGGTYEYTGTVGADEFVCTYDSTFDKGVFRMKRGNRKLVASSQSPVSSRP